MSRPWAPGPGVRLALILAASPLGSLVVCWTITKVLKLFPRREECAVLERGEADPWSIN